MDHQLSENKLFYDRRYYYHQYKDQPYRCFWNNDIKTVFGNFSHKSADKLVREISYEITHVHESLAYEEENEKVG